MANSSSHPPQNWGLPLPPNRENRESPQTDRRSKTAQQRFEAFALQTYDALLATDAEGTVLSVSQDITQMLGYAADTVTGSLFVSFVHPDFQHDLLKTLRRAATSQSIKRIDFRIRHADGEWVWVRGAFGGDPETLAAALPTTSRPHSELPDPDDDECPVLVCALRRIDHEKAARQRLVEFQTLRGLAQFAGGIAHDFNNLLTVISGYAELLPEDEMSREIRAAAGEASQLTNQLLAFGRQRSMTPTVFDLSQLVAETNGMIRPLLRDNITLALDLGPALWPVKAERAQIRQAVLNLVTNARDAMHDGGHLKVKTAKVVLDEEFAHSLSLAAGQYVQLEIQDSGIGMSESVRERAFEPFFTTKATGHGTGLGLPSVFGAIRQASGAVLLESEVDRGTTVTLYLPRSTEQLTGRPDSAPRRLRQQAQRSERILLIEDQPEVRGLVDQTLKLAGYQVTATGSADEALAQVESSDPFDLLITDVVMPGLQGPELVQRLRKDSPHLPTLFISGYHESDLGLSQDQQSPTEFLGKPFAPAELLRAVEKLQAATKRVSLLAD